MKKKLFFITLLLVFALIACGGEEEEDDWGNDGDGGNSGNNEENGGWESQEDKPSKILKTEGFLHITALAFGLDDILYVGGAAKEESKKSDALLVTFDAKGRELWRKQWDYQESADTVNYLVADKYGNIYVAGDTTNGDVPFVIKFAPDGTKIWEQFPELDFISASLALDNQQNVYISHNNEIVKYSTDGKKLQNYKISDESSTVIKTLIVDSEGNLYAGGRTNTDLFSENVGNDDSFLVKIAPDGTQFWGKQWGSENADWVKKILIGGNNSIFITSATYQNGESDLEMFFKFSSDGKKMWGKTNMNGYLITMCGDDIYMSNPSAKNGLIDKYNSNGEYIASSIEYESTFFHEIICNNNDIYAIISDTKGHTNIIKIPSSEIK